MQNVDRGIEITIQNESALLADECTITPLAWHIVVS